jgi:hypothetical protein
MTLEITAVAVLQEVEIAVGAQGRTTSDANPFSGGSPMNEDVGTRLQRRRPHQRPRRDALLTLQNKEMPPTAKLMLVKLTITVN